MKNQEIEALLFSKLNLKKIHVTGDEKHIHIIAVGHIFNNTSSVKRQQIVYKPLINMITEKHIHAVSIESYTPQEWKIKNKKSDD